jgi:hypothetical protein
VETEKKNRKGETLKNPEVTEDYSKFTRGVDRADQILHYYPRWRETVQWTKNFVLFLLHMAAPNSFILLKKFTTNQNQKGKGYAFKYFILDSVRKMIEPEEREEENDSADDEPVASRSTAPMSRPRKRQPMQVPVWRVLAASQEYKWFHQVKKDRCGIENCRVCSAHKEERSPVLSDRRAIRRFAKLSVSASSTRRNY